MITPAGTRIEHDHGNFVSWSGSPRGRRCTLVVWQEPKVVLHKVITPDRASDSSAPGSRGTQVDGADGEAVAANSDETAERKRRVGEAAHLVANRSAGLNERLA